MSVGSSGVGSGVLQAVVDPDQLREAAGRARLLKFHGCILHATNEPAVFRKYLTGSHTQIVEWPNKQVFAAMRSAVTALATNHKTLVLGLSIQDNNLQSVFSAAKEITIRLRTQRNILEVAAGSRNPTQPSASFR